MPFACLTIKDLNWLRCCCSNKGSTTRENSTTRKPKLHMPQACTRHTIASSHIPFINKHFASDGLLHEPQCQRNLFTTHTRDMPKSTPRPDFKFHVDPSCLTDSTDLAMPAERIASNQTIVHHDSWSETKSENTMDESQLKQDVSQPPDEDASEEEQKARERQIDRIEAQIQAAARAVVASFEDNTYYGEGSVLSARTDESYNAENLAGYEEGSALSTQTYETYDQENPQLGYDPENSQLTYEGSEGAYETEDDIDAQRPAQDEDEAGDSSSHHDGDVEDDIFSHSENSGRSSINSCHDTSDESNSKELTSPVVGEEAAEPISRIPSAASYTPMPNPHTPSKGMSRPTFRNPSSVRAMQMSSPPPSIFSSPRSSKRQFPTGSRIGTPNSYTSFSPSKRTPTRFKTKKEPPLVLLHVTVLPLTWPHSRAISSPEVPPSLQHVRDNYHLLHEKLGDTVLERGILLPHPQDSYEVLEERLLEALELPVRPRALILKCGHYMGPDTPISDEEGQLHDLNDRDKKWCDICEREVKIEGSSMNGKRETRFRVKVYASNGLMRAGAWAAAWREMERVDVELEPFVEGNLVGELEDFAASFAHIPASSHVEDDGFVDENETVEHNQHSAEAAINLEEAERAQEEELLRRQRMEEERLREIYGDGHPRAESRMSSTHRQPAPRAPTSRIEHGDSLPELLLAAFKVAMRDPKNVLICVLSVLVLLLALKPGTGPRPHLDPIIEDSGLKVVDIIMEPVNIIPPETIETSDVPIHTQEPIKAQSVSIETDILEADLTHEPENDNSFDKDVELHSGSEVPEETSPSEIIFEEDLPSELPLSNLHPQEPPSDMALRQDDGA